MKHFFTMPCINSLQKKASKKKNLKSPNQSDFKPGDLFIDQLLSITHNISESFDNDVEVWGTDLDISKVLDR